MRTIGHPPPQSAGSARVELSRRSGVIGGSAGATDPAFRGCLVEITRRVLWGSEDGAAGVRQASCYAGRSRRSRGASGPLAIASVFGFLPARA